MAAVSPTEESVYCFRLQLLTIDLGTLVLRHKFDQIVPPQTLQAALNKPNTRGRLDSLRKKNVISPVQWELLFPTSGEPNSATFDVSLICCLLLNICGLNVQSHPPGWYPPSMDTSTEADLIRIRFIRNKIAHLNATSMSEQNFQDSWAEMEQVMLRLGAGIPTLHESILNLKDECLDPAKEKEYQKKMKDWEEMDKSHHQSIDEVNLKLTNTLADIDKVKIGIQNEHQKSVELGKAFTIYERKIETIGKKQEAETSRIDKLDEDSKLQRTQLKSVESKQIKLEQDVSGTRTKLDEMSESASRELPPRLKYLAAITKRFIEDLARDEVYVTTHAHETAKKILNSTGCLILTGPPGEGKTTMATKLVSETTQTDSCIKLNEPSDWDHMYINKASFDMIFIDDMFGAGALDEKLLASWSHRLPEIETVIQAKEIKVIITTRHYILKEAKEKLHKLILFKEENIQQLASFDLTDSERVAIIEKHLEKTSRTLPGHYYGSVEDCCREYEYSFTFNQKYSLVKYSLPNDFNESMYLRKSDSIKAMIGFPEMVSLFVCNENLFKMGSYFFGQPFLFFKKCIEELYLDKENFLALILIWTRPDKQLRLKNLKPSNVSNDIKETTLKFGICLKGKTIGVLHKSLKYHKDGFLRFDSSSGTYSFTHNTVKDMVGLVAGQDYPDTILEFVDEEFMLQYVTTDEARNDGFHIFVEEYNYQELCKAICRVMKQGKFERFFVFVTKQRDFKILHNFGRVLLPPYNELNLNTSLLKHDCFQRDEFVRMFCQNKVGRYFLSKPADILPPKWMDWNFGEYIPIYLPSLALLYKHVTLLKEFFKPKFPRNLDKAQFLRTNLMIASHQGMKDVIEFLLIQGAIVCEDAIYFAAAKGYDDCLEYLLESRDGSYIAYTNSVKGNSPLIAAAKRGYVKCIKTLLRHGADISHRNKNGWSALDKAILNRRPEACQILLENKAPVSYKTGKFKRTPLHMSADIGEEEISKLLLQYGASVTAKDYRGHYPIHCASLREHNSIVEMLLKADVSRITLKRRVSYGRNSVIKGADLFHIGVCKKNLELIQILLKYDVSPNVCDFYGQTPIYRAICECKLEANAALVEGIDPFYCIMKEVMDIIFKARTGRFSLAEFENYWYFRIIEKLLPVADVRKADRHGYTPLHAAVHKGMIKVVKLLCPVVDENARDKYGKTPLHTACEQLDLEIFRTLIEDYRADFRMRTKSGMSIFDILDIKTSWKSICRRYRDKKSVENYMLEKPPYESFRKIIAARDPEFANPSEKATHDEDNG